MVKASLVATEGNLHLYEIVDAPGSCGPPKRSELMAQRSYQPGKPAAVTGFNKDLIRG